MASSGGSLRLPAEVNAFIGRGAATAEIHDLLVRGRLVTLIGAGGTGKSRLAVHAARQMATAFPDGVTLVELAGLRDPALVGKTVASSLGLLDLSNSDPEAEVIEYAGDNTLLLILDNCEHLLETTAALVVKLLASAPRVRVLATSREPFGVAGESVWSVPPLSVPRVVSDLGAGSGVQYESIALFQERAASIVPGFVVNAGAAETVARICQRLDGLPLAIELAAVQLRFLSLEDILTRLEDRFRLLRASNRGADTRHQTLRAAVAWSFDLCTDLERLMWARLSLFPGEFDLGAAEEICAEGTVSAEEVFAGIAGLVDKSVLIRAQDVSVSRYRMLETIRQFGLERCEPEAQLTVRRRHRDYFLKLCERAEEDWFGPNQVRWLDILDQEQANVRSALDFCLSNPAEVRTGLRLASSFHWYWVVRAVRDGRLWLDRLLALPGEPSTERAKALWVCALVTLAGSASDVDTARAWSLLEECSTLATKLNDRSALANALQVQGVACGMQGRLSAAVEYLERAVDEHRRAGAPEPVVTSASRALATGLALFGQTDRAISIAADVIERARAHGETWTCSWALWTLVVARWGQGDLKAAAAHARECLELSSLLKDQLGFAACVEFLTLVALVDRHAERGTVLLGISEKMWDPVAGHRLRSNMTFAPIVFQIGPGGPRPCGQLDPSELIDERRSWAIEVLGEEAFRRLLQRGRELDLDSAISFALGGDIGAIPHTTGPQGLAELTHREREVTWMLAEGASNKEIAARLSISRRTVETHVQRILAKLRCTSRSQVAARFANRPSGHVVGSGSTHVPVAPGE